MEDKADDRHNQKKMNQASSNMKSEPSQKPHDEQDDKQKHEHCNLQFYSAIYTKALPGSLVEASAKPSACGGRQSAFVLPGHRLPVTVLCLAEEQCDYNEDRDWHT